MEDELNDTFAENLKDLQSKLFPKISPSDYPKFNQKLITLLKQFKFRLSQGNFTVLEEKSQSIETPEA
jgi:hypothetical protein